MTTATATATTVCQVPSSPSPCPSPPLSKLEVRAQVVREAYRHWAFTLATPCSACQAPVGLPCEPPSRYAAGGTICVERAFAAARRSNGR